MAGKPDSFRAFDELASLLLGLTVLHPTAGLRLYYGPDRRRRAVLGGLGQVTDPLRLRDGHFLRFTIGLFMEDTEKGPRLKVEQASYQYQADEDGKRWIFRYDYLREPKSPHPAAHVQLRGTLTEAIGVQLLSDLHFPTGRVSLEAIIRLLVDEFGVSPKEEEAIWRPVLAESERLFQEIAHRPG